MRNPARESANANTDTEHARSAAAVGEPLSALEPAPREGVSLRPQDRVESFIALTDAGKVIACNGHVDLGTGIRTAFAQIVAEELDVRIEDVTLIMGDTDRTPDQGPTTASASIQLSAVPMRRAAAQARRMLLERAALRLGVDTAELHTADGGVHCKDGRSLAYRELLTDAPLEAPIDADVPLKEPQRYRIVGQSIPRVDIPGKITGALTYVHDMRLPDMLHARVVRPPYTGRDSGRWVGRSLLAVDRSSVAHVPGVAGVIVIGDLVAVLAEREENAIRAARALKVAWRPWPDLPDLSDLATALHSWPGRRRPLKESGDVSPVLEATAHRLEATYVWPYQMHASIGPSCGLADYREGTLSVWTGSQNPHLLHADLVRLTGLAAADIRVIRMEASGCYGRNCADDAAAEAALLATRVARPVRVQLMREEEHGWEPKGTAQCMDVRGAVTGPDTLAYDFVVRYPSNNAPLLALLHTGRADPTPVIERKGDRTAIPQYRMSDVRVAVHDMVPLVRAAWLRGVAALPNVFAHESFIDELAALHGEDPIEFRLRFMDDPRAIALTRALARHSGWVPAPRRAPSSVAGSALLSGRGFAQHQYMHGSFPGVGAAWCAWVCDVEIDTATGVVRVCKVWVGLDCGLIVNPAGVRHQVHGNVLQSVSRVLKERVRFDRRGVVSSEWGGYPILRFPEVPEIDVLLADGADHPPLGVGESASVPSAAAIANAIHAASGIRLREAPFTADRLRAALAAAGF